MNSDHIIESMTLEEKCALLTGADYWHLVDLAKWGISPFMMSDGPHGLRKQAGAGDNLGLNESVAATSFPTASASACSFDINLLQNMGRALGEECRKEGISMLLGPGVNMKRSPLCGRNFEYFSEDPYLAGHLGAAYIQGVQSCGVGTSLKHFAGNNQETNRLIIDSVIDDRALREVYLQAFEIAVRAAQPWTLMTAYNLLNGSYCSQDSWLMSQLAREEWGFEGAFVTDWGALNSNDESLPAGLDLVMPGTRIDYRLDVAAAVQAGTIARDDLDAAVRHLLALCDRAHAGQQLAYTCDMAEHLVVARSIAEQSAVLLENDGILPLDVTARVAVIGAFAKQPRYQGAGSSKINPIALDTTWDALCEAGVDAHYAAGYDRETGASSEALIEEAVAQAAQNAVALLFIGLPDSLESEGYDRSDMEIPAAHATLVKRVCAANPNTVLILQGGSPFIIPHKEMPRAILLSYLAGCQGGHATANLLLGTVNPSGKLAETWPASLADTPCGSAFPVQGRRALYTESIFVGYRFYDAAHTAVAYPFGYGLSYTRFAYENLVVTKEGADDDPASTLRVSCSVRNEGSCAGKEVVQLYVAPLNPGVFKAPQQLRGFTKLALEPGQSAPVSFELALRDFAHFDTALQDWVVEQGEYELRVAASSRDVRLSARVARGGLAKPAATDDLPSYRQVSPQGFSLEDFKQLYARDFPKQLTSMRPYTINATIGDLRTSTLGKLVHLVLRILLKKIVKDNPSLQEELSETAMETPLRSVAMSGMDMKVIFGLVDVLNYHFIRGFRTIVTKR
ncbi:MAG: glycoside hydrolase family 3 C-terminal domain-containing protein [Raoultibacter sp.]